MIRMNAKFLRVLIRGHRFEIRTNTASKVMVPSLMENCNSFLFVLRLKICTTISRGEDGSGMGLESIIDIALGVTGFDSLG